VERLYPTDVCAGRRVKLRVGIDAAGSGNAAESGDAGGGGDGAVGAGGVGGGGGWGISR